MEESKLSDGLSISDIPTSFTPSDFINFSMALSELDSLLTHENIDPVQLQFIPHGSWAQKSVSLQYLADNYFNRKNNVTRRFEHKLWNALKITNFHPNLTKFIGVSWVNDHVFKVYKTVFAKLLNINCVDGGLFHKQGNFTRHGFVALPEITARQQISAMQLEDVDFHEVLLLYHKDLSFSAESTEDNISNCKWENPNGAPRVASLKMQTIEINDEL